MQEIQLKERPDGKPTQENFALAEWKAPKLGSGDVLVELHSFSLDPYMRGRMDAGKSYSKPVDIGGRMEAGGVGQVVESNSKTLKEGDFVFGTTGWATHAVLNDTQSRKLDLPHEHLSRALGVLGMPGFTGWLGLNDHGRPQAGETLVVAAATGPVGSMVGQLAKRAGLRAVGIAGSEAKCALATGEFGFDHCLNHRDFKTAKDLRSALSEHVPDGIDIYFENVAGMVLEAVLPMINVAGRIPVCGMIGWYNAGLFGGDDLLEALTAPKLWRTVLVNRLSINGFIISDHWDRFDSFLGEVAPLVEKGEIKFKEDITVGLENAPQTFIGMLEGGNHGKTVIQIK